MFEYLYVSIKLNIGYIFLIPIAAFLGNEFGLNNIYTFTIISALFLWNVFSLIKNSIYLYKAIELRNKTILKIKKEIQNIKKNDLENYINNKKDLNFEKSKEKNELKFLIKEIVFNKKFNEQTVAKNIVNKEEDNFFENFNIFNFIRTIIIK